MKCVRGRGHRGIETSIYFVTLYWESKYASLRVSARQHNYHNYIRTWLDAEAGFSAATDWYFIWGERKKKKTAQPPSDCYLNNRISSNSFLSKYIQRHFPTYARVALRKILFVSDFAQAETQCSYGKPQNTHTRTHTHIMKSSWDQNSSTL